METLSSLFLISLSVLQYFSGTYATTLTIKNNCNDVIWPVISGSPPLAGPSGFPLGPGASQTLPGSVPSSWTSRVWARTQCASSPDGRFLCATGDCGTAAVDCAGAGKPTTPATIAEFSPGSFSVSVVEGYNRAVTVSAGGCGSVGCAIDSDSVYYPPELRAAAPGAGNGSVGIKSACGAFDEAEYCCTGSYSSASNCKANSYSELFKKWCPQARTYAYDNTGTAVPCEAADYVVSFCTPANSDSPPNGGDGTGNIPDDGSSIYGKSKLDIKFGIIIGVIAAILGTILVLYIWRRCSKSGCEVKPCTCTLCSIFSCTCCLDDHHHSDKC